MESGSNFEYSDSKSSLAMCDFLTSCSAFKRAVAEAQFEEHCEVLRGIQKFVEKDKALSEHETEDIAGRIGRDIIRSLDFSKLFDRMSKDRNNFADPHFMFSFKYLEPTINGTENEVDAKNFKLLSRIAFICGYSELQYFQNASNDKKYPEYVKWNIESGKKTYDPALVQEIHYPSCLMFQIKPWHRKKSLETHFSIPKSDDKAKQISYTLKAVLIQNNLGVRVMKCKDNLMKNKLSRNSSKFIMKNATYLLYEREYSDNTQ
ncbi:hypothetical protein ENBRE01_1396 [Enteropsectra breve]|nr:hypothetical protein ENBRE01_1396 [Enteropsectra breve]